MRVFILYGLYIGFVTQRFKPHARSNRIVANFDANRYVLIKFIRIIVRSETYTDRRIGSAFENPMKQRH